MTRDEHISATIDTLLSSWERWEAEAGQQAQQDQDPESYRDVMHGYLHPLLLELSDPKPAPHASRTAPLVNTKVGWHMLTTNDARMTLTEGDVVAVEMDDKTVRQFTVRQRPWWLPHDSGVIGLHGIPGGYDIERVRARRVA